MSVGTTLFLKRDVLGTVENRLFAFEFAAKLAAGETINSSPAPVIEQAVDWGGPGPLTVGSPAVAGSQVQAFFSAPSSTPDGNWSVSCTVTTSLGNTLVASGGLKITGSKGSG